MASSGSQLNGKGIPALLRHYLALGARIVSFKLDASLSDALDALIVIDLLKGPERMLARYMGSEALAAYWNHHQGVLQ